ncbi:tetratricopeptide repeat protein [Streptomyces sp. NPDC050504]|uniref:tetratricopeptide repeat protein n=1 Tax=Streptomyces sp. NPDC050504 TaxID=3365618 RepID=UPI0037BADCAE
MNTTPLPPGWDERVAALWDAYDGDDEPVAFRARTAALAAELPAGHPRALFELASASDATGEEAEAAAYYERALAAGLSGDKRREAVIQYGSTLRNLGRAAEAVDLLYAERAAHSDRLDDPLAAFLALALHDAGRGEEALALTLTTLAPHLPQYAKSVRYYANELHSEGP